MVANASHTSSNRESLHNLDVPEGIIDILERANIYTVSKLCQQSAEYLSLLPGLGPKKMMMLKKALSQLGLSLASSK